MERVPKALEAEINAIFEESDPFSIISGLAADEELTSTIEDYADSKRTYGSCLTVVPVTASALHDVPFSIAAHWQTRLTRLELPDQDMADLEGPTEDQIKETGRYKPVWAPAYHLSISGGIETVRDSDITSFSLYVEDLTSGVSLVILKNQEPDSHDYTITNSTGDKTGTISPEGLIDLLLAFSGDPDLDIAELRQLDHTVQCDLLLQFLGQKYGVAREEYRLTGDQLEAIEGEQVQQPNIAGAVVYVKEETPSESIVSFAIERLRNYQELDSDVILRLRSSYGIDSAAARITEQKLADMKQIISSPAGYQIVNIECEEEVAGKTRQLSIEPRNLDVFTDTLQQIVASITDRVIPRQA